MEKHYEGSNILCLESGALSKSLVISIAVSTIYGRSYIRQDLEYMGKSDSR